tara:strand:- start:170 stop:805 length:636 start_codon:yes stop_codon:yes gene_type:complete
MKKNFLITYLFLLTIFTSFAQTESSIKENRDSLKVKHFSIGLKLGIPNLASGSAELTLPILNNHFAPYVDYSKFPLNFESVETTIAYTEFGINYYFNKKANGFFIGVGKGSLSTDVTFTNLLFVNDLQSLIGSGSTELNLDTTNFKLGVKTAGNVFFRFELGYGVGKIPDSLNFIASLNGISESFTESIPPIPGLGTSGILIGNIGFGFAF